MARRRKKRSTSKSKRSKAKSKRRSGKGQVPLKILEKRLGRLNAIVKKRGGDSYS